MILQLNLPARWSTGTSNSSPVKIVAEVATIFQRKFCTGAMPPVGLSKYPYLFEK